jgi:MoaA/NifB/PqqE/SkfB family radical SAM enzyme
MIAPKPVGEIQIGRDYTNPYSHGQDWVTYKLTYRCKHCGHEWTKLSEREVEIPRALIKDEYKE